MTKHDVIYMVDPKPSMIRHDIDFVQKHLNTLDYVYTERDGNKLKVVKTYYFNFLDI